MPMISGFYSSLSYVKGFISINLRLSVDERLLDL